MGSRTVGTLALSKIFIRFCQSKPHIRSTTNIKVCPWVQRQTPGCIFIPRLSRDSLHFTCFPWVATFKKDLLSVPMRCTTFHFLALVMRRSGVRFSSRAPHSGFWVAIRTPSVRKTTQNTSSLWWICQGDSARCHPSKDGYQCFPENQICALGCTAPSL